jgi:hypothetical protein
MPANFNPAALFRPSTALTPEIARGRVLELVVNDRRIKATLGRAEFLSLDGDRVTRPALVPISPGGKTEVPGSWHGTGGACAFDIELRRGALWPSEYRIVGKFGF